MVLAVLTLCAVSSTFRAAGEEPAEEAPWTKVEAWVKGLAEPAPPGKAAPAEAAENKTSPGEAGKQKSDAPPAKAAEKKPPASAEKVAEKMAEKKQPAPPEKTAVTAPVWKPSRPGERRPDPPFAKLVADRVAKLCEERLKAATTPRARFDVYCTMEQYDAALPHFLKVLSEAEKQARGRESVSLLAWETGVLCVKRPPAEWLQKHYSAWRDEQAESIAGAVGKRADGEIRDMEARFKRHQDYFQSSDGLPKWLDDTKARGELDPAVLWDLCERFHRGEPRMPLSYALTLIRLREWHPDFAQVRNGEAQHRLVELLLRKMEDRGLSLFKESSDETRVILNTPAWAATWFVKTGEALWHLAHSRLQQGYVERSHNNRTEAISCFKDARQCFLEFQKGFPANWKNRLGDRQTVTDCNRYLGEVNRALQGMGVKIGADD